MGEAVAGPKGGEETEMTVLDEWGDDNGPVVAEEVTRFTVAMRK